MLRKRLLYTAITRASKALILLGSQSLFIESAKQEKERKRETTLLKRLSE
jgi:exodeoxyribonuclease V alpha subunit